MVVVENRGEGNGSGIPEIIRAARAGGWPLELEQTLRSARACS